MSERKPSDRGISLSTSLRAVHYDYNANKSPGDSNLHWIDGTGSLRSRGRRPQMLYEAMLKLALMVDMTAPTMGWPPGLRRWVSVQPEMAEGLNSDEIIEAEKVVR